MDKQTQLTQLKAQAYDLVANIEWLESKLRETNAQIQKIATEIKDNGSAISSDNN